MKKTILAIAFFALFPLLSRSQVSDSNSHLTVHVDAEGFFYDAEYGTPFAKGFTVTGFRLSPTLVYDINERAQLRVGFNSILFAGMDSLYLLRPSLSLLYTPVPWLSFVAGTLLDDNHHQLPAPVIDPSRHIFNYQEDGIQILTKTNGWHSDTWLDWTHYLTPWTPDQELFTMGSRHVFNLFHFAREYYLNNPEDSLPPFFSHARSFDVTFPAHFMASHRGGEVKTIDTNTVTTFNEKIGFLMEYRFSRKEHIIHSLALDLPIFFYHLEDNELDHGGKALYPTLKYSCTRTDKSEHQLSLSAEVGLWHGDHYFSALGDPLFWSINDYSLQHIPFTVNTQAFNPDIRNLLTYTLSFEHSFKGIALGLKVDALHDIDLKTNDFIFSFFLRYNGLFKIK